MRRCQRIGCENSLEDLRQGAVYCGPTCKREAARARALSRDETGAPGFWDRYRQIRPARRCRTRHTAVLAVAAGLLLAVAGCGGTKTVTSTTTATQTPSPAPPFVVAGGHCANAPADTAAICQLRTVPPPLSLSSPFGAPMLRGLDGWGPPSLGALGSYQFAQAYLSYDSSKNWSRSSVAAYRRAGKGVVMDWETYATRAAAGRAAGVADAIEASRQAAADGAPGAPINGTVDFDATCAQITPYFQGWHSVLGSRAGGYGGYYQLLCLYRQGLIGHQNQQAYAWSRGLWLPANIAPLEQWLNGSTYDQDRALAPLYGQAFQSSPPPLADPYRIMDRTRRHFRVRAFSPVWGAPYTVLASEHSTMATIRRAGCHGAPRRAVCKSSKFHLTLLRGRLVRVGLREHPHYSLKRAHQGARQTIMAKQLRRMR